MNAIQQSRLAIFPRNNLPIICPSCSSSLGIIDVHSLAARHAWGIAISPLDIAAPDAEANLIRGECKSCGAELAAISIAFRRPHAPGADGADEPLPSLSLALHGTAYAGWAMIETRESGVTCIEHLFEPRPSARIERSVEYLRDHLVDDLPRPGDGGSKKT